MIRAHHLVLIGSGLVVACGDSDPAVTGVGGAASTATTGIGGVDFTGSGGHGGAGNTQNQGGHGQAGLVWDVTHGGPGAVYPRGLTVDPAGNVVVAGTYNTAAGSVDLGAGPLPVSNGDAIFVVKYGPDGAALWSKSFDAADVQGARDVACDGGGNIWLVGEFKGVLSLGGGPLDAQGNQFPDGFVAKLDPDGNHVFSRAVGVGFEESDAVTSVAIDPGGNVLLTGFFQNTIEFGGPTIAAAGGPGDYDIFVVKLDANGNHIFSKAVGSPGRQEGLAIAAGPYGNVAIAGYTTGDVDLGAGTQTFTGMGEGAVFAVYDGAGAHLFSRLYPGDGARATSIAFGSDGDLFVAGTFKGTIDLGGGELASPSANDDVVARYGPTGEVVYGVHFGGNGAEKATGIAVDDSGYAVISGWFKGTFDVHDDATLTAAAANNDAFAIRLGPPGHGFWGIQAGAVQNAQGRRVAVTDDGDVLFLGEFSGDIDLGSGPKTAPDLPDLVLARFTP